MPEREGIISKLIRQAREKKEAEQKAAEEAKAKAEAEAKAKAEAEAKAKAEAEAKAKAEAEAAERARAAAAAQAVADRQRQIREQQEEARRRAAEAAAAAAEAAKREYVVKPGDSLTKIAQKELGSGARWKEIYALNKATIGDNPDLIHPGEKLVLPPK